MNPGCRPACELTATTDLDPLRKAAPEIQPVDIGFFAGAVLAKGEDFCRMPFVWKLIAKAMARNRGGIATGMPSVAGR